jgi:hypothetical protein
MKTGTLLPWSPRCPWALALIPAVMLLACDPAAQLTVDPGAGLFDHPQPVVFVGDLLVVGNTGFRPSGDWAPGTLTVLDPKSGALINRISTSRTNPQRMVVHQDALYVVATGTLELGDFEHPTAGPGAIDIIPLHTLRTAHSPARSVPIEPLAEGPITAAAPLDLAFAGDRALLTLGVANAVRPFDPATATVGAPVWLDTPRVGLGSAQPWGERFVVIDFNADSLQVLEPNGQPWPCTVDLGEAPDDVEGPSALAISDHTAYVTLAFSGLLRAVDLTALDPADPACDAPVETIAAPIGDVPNDLHIRGDQAWVVDSGRNALLAYALSDGQAGARYAVPPGANAWHAAWRADGRFIAVTEFASHGVSVFDTLTQQHRRFGGPNQTPAPPEPPTEAQVAGEVVTAPDTPHSPQFSDPDAATNGVRGSAGGSHDVYSLGPNDALVLRWPGQRLTDGPGADFVVFENAFAIAGGQRIFMDLVVVEVSRDGETWVVFSHDYRALDETQYSNDPALWVGFAGRTPVRLHAEDNPVDPFGANAGGDAFDLAELPPGPETDAIRRDGAVFIRLSSATAWTNPDTRAPFVADAISDGPDIDGVAARWLEPE